MIRIFIGFQANAFTSSLHYYDHDLHMILLKLMAIL